ncbi:MAG: bifunctional enoyl-CoA hydratase/phosphate acetyltransferase [Hydrogenophaga sp.]|nr:bifunctional enoyl-CoA hydratase/phosphate acetyltransferase [Hydrogenophaga sp.]
MNMGNDFVENHTFDELHIGQSARLLRTLTPHDIQAFAAVSGDTNPAHLNAEYANDTLFHGVIGHGMWSGALISALLGTQFPGTGTIYLDQALHFSRPVRIGDTLTVSATVIAKDTQKKVVELACEALNQKGECVVSGVARVLAPAHKVRMPRGSVPTIQVFDPEARFNDLLAMVRHMPAVRCAVAHPCDEGSLRGAVEAAGYGLLLPVLMGPENRIRALAEEFDLDLNGMELVNTPHSHASAEHAAALAAAGEVASLMKGSLHTNEFIQAVLARKELRTGRRMSHVFRFDVPLYSKPLLITDAALNIRPTLEEKVDIVQNAIDFARLMGVDVPRVAVLSAVENVSSNMPSTLDAAALCKMADRGQIRGGLLDGPLAFDNAISAEAALIKNIESPVAGQADILVVPDLESGNMLAKQLEYLAGATGAGIVLGARVPIALTSRADGPRSRAASALLAQLVAHHGKTGKS